MKCRKASCNHNLPEGVMPNSVLDFEIVDLPDGRRAVLERLRWRDGFNCWRYLLSVRWRNRGHKHGKRRLRELGLL